MQVISVIHDLVNKIEEKRSEDQRHIEYTFRFICFALSLLPVFCYTLYFDCFLAELHCLATNRSHQF